MLKVNAHIHTPYSFSSFSSVEEAVAMAKREDIGILGVNDFFTTEAYEEFERQCRQAKIYPLFNIEFIGVDKTFKEKGWRINDPSNVGRIYFCGKGLSFPVSMSEHSESVMRRVQHGSNEHVKMMIAKCNQYFNEQGIDLRLDFEHIKKTLAKNLVRERHLAKVIRQYGYGLCESASERKSFLQKLYAGKESKADVNDESAAENEIRNMLLKSGGACFVQENENAFLSWDEIISLILDAGGIPCYPMLLDFHGNFTEFEKDWEQVHEVLSARHVRCVELIPSRNEAEQTEKFVKFFTDKKYLVLFGTEHNTPSMPPLTVPIADELQKLSYKNACVVAAHQQLKREGGEGFLNREHIPKTESIEELSALGDRIVSK
ncbi:MAG: hypothetical protein CRN43_08500 [Candidatus Nephrothrix sp. EaCA]|nr:MAG: hypothetical protein CRN43_08500 [Candidatus Nephrothrix sp. EaCA]